VKKENRQPPEPKLGANSPSHSFGEGGEEEKGGKKKNICSLGSRLHEGRPTLVFTALICLGKKGKREGGGKRKGRRKVATAKCSRGGDLGKKERRKRKGDESDETIDDS